MKIRLPNHLSENLISKGMLGPSSLITKGVLETCARYEIVGPGGVIGSGAGFPTSGVFKKHDIRPEEVDYIKVYIDWSKQPQKWKKVYAKRIKKSIKAEFMESIKKHITIKIEVEKIGSPGH